MNVKCGEKKFTATCEFVADQLADLSTLSNTMGTLKFTHYGNCGSDKNDMVVINGKIESSHAQFTSGKHGFHVHDNPGALDTCEAGFTGMVDI